MAESKSRKKKSRRIVVKVGSNTLTGADGKIDSGYIKKLVEQIAVQHALGVEVIIVSSGAVRAGAERLGIAREDLDVAGKQVAAAVGQGLLMERYTRLFDKHGIVTAQILLTRDVMTRRNQYLNARNTFLGLLERGVVPIVNENDSVAVEEIKFGDNDSLSILTAVLCDADPLILLSDVAGLYSDDPKENPDAQLVCEVRDIDASIASMARDTRTVGGTGGMITKIKAARAAVAAGITTIIAHGREPEIITKIMSGRCSGTTFIPKEHALSGRKKWIAFGAVPKGKITVNAGAGKMMASRGKSLLPVGVTAVFGRFDTGACIDIADENGVSFARGITNYSSSQIKKIMGLHSDKIEQVLGFKISDDVVHRDNMALL